MNSSAYWEILEKISPVGVTLVAVSKAKSVTEIQSLYNLGQRDFGENYVQELLEKQKVLPSDIRWHFIGHLQSNKVKLIAPFVQLIQSVDSLKLLQEIDKQAGKNGLVIRCLLQIHVATEETKFGMDSDEINLLVDQVKLLRHEGQFQHVSIAGVMGMASFTKNEKIVQAEFKSLRDRFIQLQEKLPGDPVKILSMGMSSDYPIAMACGSTMIRIGSLLFGERQNSLK